MGADGVIKTEADKLAEEVLAEVPDQLVGYMASMDIKPGDQPVQKDNRKNEDENEENDDMEGNIDPLEAAVVEEHAQ